MPARFVIAIAFVLSIVSGCDKPRDDRTTARPKDLPHFNCSKTPFLDQPERQCGSAASCTPETCFYPDHAFCVFYSTSWQTVELMRRTQAISDGTTYTPTPHTRTWSDKTISACLPTLEECNSFRNGIGKPNDQPPVKTACRETPAEQDPSTAPLTF